MPTSSAAAPGPLSALPPELHALLDGPCVMHLATRNAALEPLSILAFGLRAAADDREVTVFVPASLAPLILDNLRDNGQMAVTLVRPSDHRSLQIKGVWLGERRTTDDDRAFLTRYRDAMLNEMGQVGVPRSVWNRIAWWPSVALRLEVRDAFVQTPGPSAGRRLERPAAGAA
ncbi:MAG TPA: hypothetical protein VIF57_19990 [Polyangia bacterium]|jgi:hypothetical protein